MQDIINVIKSKHGPLIQTCDGSAKALLAYPTSSFPYQVLHVTDKRNPKMSFKPSKIHLYHGHIPYK